MKQRTILLADYIAARMALPFAWGTNDCMTFCVGFAELASGRKLLPDQLWASELQAARMIKDNGGLEAALDAHFTRIKHPNYAQDGDIAICAGVVSLVSGRYVVAPGEKGLVFKPRMEAEHAWTY